MLELSVTGPEYGALDLTARGLQMFLKACTVSYSISFIVYQVFHYEIRDENDESVWPSRKSLEKDFLHIPRDQTQKLKRATC